MPDIDLTGHHDELSRLRASIAARDAEIAKRDAALDKLRAEIRQCDDVIRRLRQRVGEGFRAEVRAFSDSIKDQL